MPETSAKSLFLSIRDARWHCRIYGQGEKLLIAFHGFSQDYSFFAPLQQALDSSHTIVAVDMPMHGKTEWPAGAKCTSEVLRDLAEAIKEEFGKKDYELIGFSMGGGYAWSLAQHYPRSIKRLYLAAPEGLTTNYGVLLTTVWIGRVFLRAFVKFPQPLMALNWMLYKVGLLSEKLYQFVILNTNTPKIRQQLEGTWIAMSALNKSHKGLAEATDREGILAWVIVGSKDPLIKVKDAKRLAEMLSDQALIVVPKGHFVVDASLGRRMQELA